MDPDRYNELISTFEGITKLDREQCRAILNNYNWNLDAAVRSVFPDLGDPQISSPPSYTASQPYQRRDNDIAAITTTTTTTTTSSSLQHTTPSQVDSRGGGGIISSVINLPLSIAQMGFGVVSSVFGFGFRLVGNFLPAFPFSGTEDDGQSSTRRFITNYENVYGQIHPNFFNGPFKTAIEYSNRELKLLIVYLHSELHHHTPDFCRNTLNSPALKLFLDEHFIVWGGSINQTGEAMQVSHTLSASAYPFIGVLGTMTSTAYFTVLDRIHGNIPPEELITRLTNLLEAHSTTIAITRADREERETNRRLREEQDRAYKESLALDQEKERKRKEEEKKKEEEKLAKEREELEKRMKEDQLKQDLERKRNNLPSEPSSDDSKSISKVRITLPNGTRLERKFLQTEKLSTLYDFVDINFLENSHFEGEYVLEKNYPKVRFSNRNMTLQEAGLGGQVVLFVAEK